MRLLSSALGLTLVAAAAVAGAAPAAAATPVLPHKVGGFKTPAKRVKVSLGYRAADALPATATVIANLPPVGDQGQIGSCVAWTIAHSIMGFYAKRDGGTGAPYAPLYLYMRAVAPGGAPNAGLNPEKALTEATNNGVDTLADYTQGDYNYKQAPTAAEIANAAKYKLAGWKTLWVGDKQGDKAKTAIQQAIAGGSPVAIGMPVFKDFMSLKGGALYKTITGSSLGGHMITAYAYDAEGIWIRNQWGTAWGASGDAHLAWGFVTQDVLAAYTATGVKTPGAEAAAKPVVTGLSTATGPVGGGTAVTISGTGLADATAVTFGGTTATFRKDGTGAATKLIATAPAHAAGSTDVIVTGSAGASAAGDKARFTYIVPAPTVTALSASTGLTTTSTPVTITGTGFGTLTAVTAGGDAVAFQKVSDSQVQVTMPPHAAGKVSLKLTNAGGSFEATALPFTYNAPPAVALTPNLGGAKVATMAEFNAPGVGAATKVIVGGSTTTFQRLGDAKLRVVLPPHAVGPVSVVVITPTTTISATFTYRA